MSTDLYAQAALFYDMEYGDEQADVRLYAHLAERTRGPILDAGVGTGRIAFGLAEFGRRVVGIDSSPAMLARAEAKQRDLDASSVTLHQADLRDFDLGEQFAMAVLALNTFAHMLTQDDQTARVGLSTPASCAWRTAGAGIGEPLPLANYASARGANAGLGQEWPRD